MRRLSENLPKARSEAGTAHTGQRGEIIQAGILRGLRKHPGNGRCKLPVGHRFQPWQAVVATLGQSAEQQDQPLLHQALRHRAAAQPRRGNLV
ncbi:hypothetical protein DRB17_03685 [Ferruginivarius sediminum]|uniref:Uncharacterized protein n=1 Tax=Ferruginivarius sediminum TaxID=2661937 RepID=A0A369TDX2_9PROT|nr:hypothetical protein DRB17_03685 [Ferruginivarius sediminum]